MRFRLDSFKIDSHEMVGARLRVDGYLSRTGVQVYDQGGGVSRREYRDPAEVFDDAALQSFRAMPITIGHPPTKMLDATNWRTLSHGHVGDDVRRADDGRHTMASIWVLDQATQDRVTRGDLTELSVGYFAELDETPGTSPDGERYDARQTQIRGNHLALLPAGRARGGAECRIRLDENGDADANDNDNTHAPARGPEERRRMKIRIRADGYDHEVEADTDTLSRALEKERERATKEHADLTAKLDEATAKLDAATARADEAEGKLAEATDPAKLGERIDRLTKLRADAAAVAGKAVEGLSETEIRSAALTARGIDVAGKSDAYLEARFDAALETARNQTVAAVRGETAGNSGNSDNPRADGLDLTAIRSARLARGGV